MPRWRCYDQEYPDDADVVVDAATEEQARDAAYPLLGYDHDDRDWIVCEPTDLAVGMKVGSAPLKSDSELEYEQGKFGLSVAPGRGVRRVK